MLARLAHFVTRHRWSVIAAWIALTLFGGFAAGKVSKRWYQSFSIPGKSAYETSQRTLKAFGVGVRPPTVVVYHTQGDATKRRCDQGVDGARREGEPGRADELVLLDARKPDVRLEGSAHHLRGDLSGGRREVRHEERRRPDPRRRRGGPAAGHDGAGDRPRPARGGVDARRERRAERAARGGDRRARRARDPALRLRHAAGGADADRRRDRGDPQHVHADLDPDLHHQRLDHRAVPDRARRARRGDRLRAADDLPLPRRAARGRGRRDRARRDDDARGPLGDRLRLDRGGRPALAGHPAAAVHPLDGHRRDADPRRLGDRRDHAAACAARGARRAHQQRARDAEAVRRQRPSRGRRSGAAGRGSCCGGPSPSRPSGS